MSWPAAYENSCYTSRKQSIDIDSLTAYSLAADEVSLSPSLLSSGTVTTPFLANICPFVLLRDILTNAPSFNVLNSV